MTNLTAQEAFNTVAAHLLSQGEKSVVVEEDGKIFCAYRGSRGRKCAIGVLIPDEVYKPVFEDYIVSGLIRDYGLFPPELASLLHRLQGIHDTVDSEFWGSRLRMLAASQDLDGGVVDECEKVNTGRGRGA